MAITNAQLAAKMSELMDRWRAREDMFRTWLAGPADGGDFGDGRYPLSDHTGNTYYVYSPAALMDFVSGPVGVAEGHADDASAAQSAAEAAQAAAEAARSLALGYRDEAQAAKDLALLYRDEAANSEANSLVHRNAAEQAATDAAATYASLQDDLDAATAAAVVQATQEAVDSAAAAAASEADAASSASAAAGSAAASAASAAESEDARDAAVAAQVAAEAAALAAQLFDPDLYVTNVMTSGDWSDVTTGRSKLVSSSIDSPNPGIVHSGISIGSHGVMHTQIAGRDNALWFRGMQSNSEWTPWRRVAVQNGDNNFTGLTSFVTTVRPQQVIRNPDTTATAHAFSRWENHNSSVQFQAGVALNPNVAGFVGTNTNHPLELRVNNTARVVLTSADLDILVNLHTLGIYDREDSSFWFWTARNHSGSYGTWRIGGNKGGYCGLMLDHGATDATFMEATTRSNGMSTCGIYRQTEGRWIFYEDATSFRVSHPIHAGTNVPYMRVTSGAEAGGGRVTISTGTPSGTPRNGDIWIQRAP